MTRRPRAARIAALIKRLNDDDFQVRDAAGEALEKIGAAALPLLRKAAASSEHLELRQQAKRLVQVIEERLYGEVRRFTGHTDGVITVAVSPDGRRALSGSWQGGTDKIVRLWDVATAKELRPLKGHTAAITCVAFSPDGKRALSAGLDKTVRLWDLDTGKELKSLTGHAAGVYAVVFSKDGQLAASAGDEAPIRVWDLEKGVTRKVLVGHTGAVRGLACPPTAHSWPRPATMAASASGSSPRARRSARWRHRTPGSRPWPSPRTADASPPGAPTGLVRLWDVKTGQELRRLKGHEKEVHTVAFTTDGNARAVGQLRPDLAAVGRRDGCRTA